MINDPNMINKLLADFNQVPEEVIKEAIKEVIQEDKREKVLQTMLKAVLQTMNIGRYDFEENYYYSNNMNEYVHKNNCTSSKLTRKSLIKEIKNQEVEVA